MLPGKLVDSRGEVEVVEVGGGVECFDRPAAIADHSRSLFEWWYVHEDKVPYASVIDPADLAKVGLEDFRIKVSVSSRSFKVSDRHVNIVDSEVKSCQGSRVYEALAFNVLHEFVHLIGTGFDASLVRCHDLIVDCGTSLSIVKCKNFRLIELCCQVGDIILSSGRRLPSGSNSPQRIGTSRGGRNPNRSVRVSKCKDCTNTGPGSCSE